VAIAPFEVVICPVGAGKSEAVREAANVLYDELRSVGVDVILNDRDERPGVMFADWELIGVPVRVTVGERGLKDGTVELQPRAGGRSAPVEAVPKDALAPRVVGLLRELRKL
jgi:prolyl-tRNA synthetase